MIAIFCRLFHWAPPRMESRIINRDRFYQRRTFLVVEDGWNLVSFNENGTVTLERPWCPKCYVYRKWLWKRRKRCSSS